MTKLVGSLTFAGTCVALMLTFSPGKGVAQQPALGWQSGQLHIVKDCPKSTYQGGAGQYCTVLTSDLAQIPPGSKIYYDQAAGVPTAAGTSYLDSNIFVYVGPDDWAVGRCTLNLVDYLGLCTLSDGKGQLAGVTARVNVTYKPGGDGYQFAWDGTYSFQFVAP
jgi:hypothetical protein